MFNMFQNIFGINSDSDASSSSPMQDPTIYKVETRNHHTYIGQIIYQDNVVMRIRCEKSMPVKVLKDNILKIIIQPSLI